MARPAAFASFRLAASRRAGRRAHRQACQIHAGRIVARFLGAALLWIAVSAALSLTHLPVNPSLKAFADLSFLAFATAYLHAKILRALAAVETADGAYRAVSVELIERLSIVGEYRDDLTGGHARRIGRYAGILGRQLGLDAEECERLELAATLHDLGKVAIPDAILKKSGDLTPAERAHMETHVAIGAQMLDGGSHPLVRTAHLIALTHHENWDGSGYPQALVEEKIPLVGRIVAVCDVFDALVSSRPYKEAWLIEEAVAEIRRLSGRKFDPRVVEAFVACRGEMLPTPGAPKRFLIKAA